MWSLRSGSSSNSGSIWPAVLRNALNVSTNRHGMSPRMTPLHFSILPRNALRSWMTAQHLLVWTGRGLYLAQWWSKRRPAQSALKPTECIRQKRRCCTMSDLRKVVGSGSFAKLSDPNERRKKQRQGTTATNLLSLLCWAAKSWWSLYA